MSKIRFTVVDTHYPTRRRVCNLLERHRGWKVCGESATGAEALEQASRLNPNVVVMSLSIAETNAFEPIRQMRAAAPEVCILILGTSEAGQGFQRAIKAGARGYVATSDLGGLVEVVESLYEKRALSARIVPRGVARRRQTDRPAHDPMKLTPRQIRVVQLLAQGKSNKEVASVLGISTRTAEAHRYRIMKRLKIRTISELVRFALRNQLIEP